MHVAARARLVLARRPWIYWLSIAMLTVVVAVAVNDRVASIDAARDEWGDLRTVVVADGQLEPGDVAVVRLAELPVAAVPDAALTDVGPDTLVRQRVADGEVLTTLDVTTRSGPASAADAGHVVVPISDPLVRHVEVGLRVRIVADGVVLADEATVVDVADDVVFVALAERLGPVVSAAAQQGIASLLYLP